MAHNQSYKITPEVIVKDNHLFRIPLYQRLFAWKEPEVFQLMEDLRNHFQRHPQKDYYLGMLTVVKQTGRLDLIDGQQRSTVMMLLAIAFINTLPEGETKSLWTAFFDSANRLFFNGRSQDRKYLRSLVEQGEEKGKDNIREQGNENQKSGSEYISYSVTVSSSSFGENRSNYNNYKNTAMEEGLSTIYKYLLDPHHFPKGVEEVEEFASQVYRHLTIFVTELPSHYVENPTSLNEYFEAMNSCGKSLEQHEILKVELLKDYSGADKLTLTRLWNVVSDFENPIIRLDDDKNTRQRQVDRYMQLIEGCRRGEFKEIVSQICSDNNQEEKAMTIAEIEVRKYDFSDKVPRNKEDAIISFPQFLLFVLSLHLDKEEVARIHPSKLHDTFNNPQYRLPVERVGEFYKDLLFYRLLMDMYVVRLKYGASSSSHYLISRDVDEQDRSEQAHTRLRQFQSMLDVSTEPHIWILPLMRYLKRRYLGNHNPNNPIRDDSAQSDSIDTIDTIDPIGPTIPTTPTAPTQFEILKLLMLNDLHRNGHQECPEPENLTYISSPKPRYWLWRTDYAIWEKLVTERKEAFVEMGYDKIDTEAVRHYEFRSNRSIEHLHPQTENPDESSSWELKDIHSFGNLAMISQSFNSQQSNLPVHVKFANLEVQISNKSLQSLKLYLMYLKAKGSESEWTLTAKDEHQKEMLDILRSSIDKVKSYEPRESCEPSEIIEAAKSSEPSELKSSELSESLERYDTSEPTEPTESSEPSESSEAKPKPLEP